MDSPLREDIMYWRGLRDGMAGLDMSSTSKEYHEGWIKGRTIYLENCLIAESVNDFPTYK